MQQGERKRLDRVRDEPGEKPAPPGLPRPRRFVRGRERPEEEPGEKQNDGGEEREEDSPEEELLRQALKREKSERGRGRHPGRSATHRYEWLIAGRPGPESAEHGRRNEGCEKERERGREAHEKRLPGAFESRRNEFPEARQEAESEKRDAGEAEREREDEARRETRVEPGLHRPRNRRTEGQEVHFAAGAGAGFFSIISFIIRCCSAAQGGTMPFMRA